jgi:hypothetical protein
MALARSLAVTEFFPAAASCGIIGRLNFLASKQKH